MRAARRPAATVRDGSRSAATAGRSRHGEHHGARKPPGGCRDRRQQPGCLRGQRPAHRLGHASGSRICVANYAFSMLGVAWGLPAWRTDAPAEAARAVAAEEAVAATLRTRRAPCSADMARSRWQERSALIPSGAGCAGSNPAGGARGIGIGNAPIELRKRDTPGLPIAPTGGHSDGATHALSRGPAPQGSRTAGRPGAARPPGHAAPRTDRHVAPGTVTSCVPDGLRRLSEGVQRSMTMQPVAPACSAASWASAIRSSANRPAIGYRRSPAASASVRPAAAAWLASSGKSSLLRNRTVMFLKPSPRTGSTALTCRSRSRRPRRRS